MKIKKHDKELEKGLSTMGMGLGYITLLLNPVPKGNDVPETIRLHGLIQEECFLLLMILSTERNYLLFIWLKSGI